MAKSEGFVTVGIQRPRLKAKCLSGRWSRLLPRSYRVDISGLYKVFRNWDPTCFRKLIDQRSGNNRSCGNDVCHEDIRVINIKYPPYEKSSASERQLASRKEIAEKLPVRCKGEISAH